MQVYKKCTVSLNTWIADDERRLMINTTLNIYFDIGWCPKVSLYPKVKNLSWYFFRFSTRKLTRKLHRGHAATTIVNVAPPLIGSRCLITNTDRRTGVGLLKLYSLINKIFDSTNVHIRLYGSHLCLTGVTTSELLRPLSNINLIFHSYWAIEGNWLGIISGMDCRLMSPNDYMNQGWLILKDALMTYFQIITFTFVWSMYTPMFKLIRISIFNLLLGV